MKYEYDMIISEILASSLKQNPAHRITPFLVVAIDGRRFQIGNNRGGINGWIGENAIFGRATAVERR